MKEKLLLLAPDFFEYPYIITENIENKYQVDVINNENNLYRELWNNSKLRKLLRFLFKHIYLSDQKKIEKLVFNEYIKNPLFKDHYDVIFCIKGDLFPDCLYKLLKNNNSNSRFIMYQWDDTKLLQKTSHFKYFNERYSFNKDDCKVFNMRYLPMFTRVKNDIDISNKRIDILLVGTIDRAHKKRLIILEKIYKKYSSKYNILYYLYAKNADVFTYLKLEKKPLSFDEYIDLMAKSKCVLDIGLKNQKAPTTRFNDAIITNTKVITNNMNIRNYYKENIDFINDKKIEINEAFVRSPYLINNNVIGMTINKWIYELQLL